MKSRWLLFLILVVPFAGEAQSRPKPDDPVFGVDKVKHFFVAGFVEAVTFSSLQAVGVNRSPARAGAISATVVVSFGREFHDRRTKGLFSFRDLAWDAIGASAALIVINKVRR